MRYGQLFSPVALAAALVTTAGTAHADGPPKDLPRWCGSYDGKMDTSSGSIEEDAKNTGYATDRVAQSLAKASCGWRSDAEGTRKIRDRVVAGRVKFKEATGFSDAEVDEMLAIEMDKKVAEAANDTFCRAIKVDEDDVTPRELSQAKALRYLVCDRGYGAGEYDWADLTEIEKVAQVNNCFTSVAGSFSRDSDKFAKQPWKMLQFATCNVLATRIDGKKFGAEIAADKRFNRYAALWARATLHDTRLRTTAVQTVYQRIASKSPLLKELLFTSAEKGYTDFMTMYAASTPVIDQARALLAGAGKVKTLAKDHPGCAATFEPLMVKAMADKHPTDLAGVTATFRDPYMFYVSTAFAICEAIEGHDLVAHAYSTRMVGGQVAAAPIAAATGAFLEMLFANADEIGGASDTTPPRLTPRGRLDVRAPASTERQAVIDKAVPTKDGAVKVTFKKDVWIEQLLNCRDTNRIDHISDDGKFVYRQSCTPAGTKKHVDKEEPVLVEARFASALKAGRFLEFRVTTDKQRLALPYTVYADKTKKQLVGFLGFAL